VTSVLRDFFCVDCWEKEERREDGGKNIEAKTGKISKRNELQEKKSSALLTAVERDKSNV
jgi:hypothetical protein